MRRSGLIMLFAVTSWLGIGATTASAAVTWSNNITGSGAQALSSPEGIAMYDHNVVVADSANNRLETFAPDGTFQRTYSSVTLNDPRQAVQVGSDFITADAFDARVVKINAATGANDGAFGTLPNGISYSIPRGVAATSDQSRVAVADAGNDAIYLFDASGTLLNTLTGAGSSAGAISGPEGVTFDGSGNAWVADTQNHRVVEFAPDGTVLTSWGDSAYSPFYPTGIAVDPQSGNVWVADWLNSRVSEFSSSGTLLATLANAGTNDPLHGPVTVALDSSSGDLYVADENNNRIVRYAGAGSSGGAGGTPPTVTTSAADNVTTASATLHGTVNPNGLAVTDCHFVTGAEAGPTVGTYTPVPCEQSSAQIGAGTDPVAVSATPTGLTPGTTYDAWLYATNAGGTVSSSPAQTFTTPGPPQATTDAATVTDRSNIVVHADVNPDGYDTHYFFQYGPDLDHMPKDVPGPSGTDLGAGTTSQQVNGDLSVTPGQPTCFRVVAFNSQGTTYGYNPPPNAGKGLCVTTAAYTPPQVSTSLATAVGEHSFDVTGLVNPEGSQTSYYFQYTPHADKSAIQEFPGAPGPALVDSEGHPVVDDSPHQVPAAQGGMHIIVYHDAELTANTTYYYRLVAQNGGGTSYGDWQQATTRQPALPPTITVSYSKLDHDGNLIFADFPGGVPNPATAFVPGYEWACRVADGVSARIKSCTIKVEDSGHPAQRPYSADAVTSGDVIDTGRGAWQIEPQTASPTVCETPCRFVITATAVDTAGNTETVSYDYPVAATPPPSSGMTFRNLGSLSASTMPGLSSVLTSPASDAYQRIAVGGQEVDVYPDHIIAAGGANIVAAGSGNIIAAGGANIVAAGGANFVVADEHGKVVGIIAAGGANVQVISADQVTMETRNGRIIAAGSANIADVQQAIIAAGGANIIAAGGANVVAQADIIGAGGANIIAAGGANLGEVIPAIIAAGGANFGTFSGLGVNGTGIGTSIEQISQLGGNLDVSGDLSGGALLQAAMARTLAATRGAALLSGHARFTHAHARANLVIRFTARGSRVLRVLAKRNGQRRRHHQRAQRLHVVLRLKFTPYRGKPVTIIRTLTVTPEPPHKHTKRRGGKQ